MTYLQVLYYLGQQLDLDPRWSVSLLDDKFVVSLPGAETKDGPILTGVAGYGATREEAAKEYLSSIAGKLLVLNAYGPNRQEIQIGSLRSLSRPEADTPPTGVLEMLYPAINLGTCTKCGAEKVDIWNLNTTNVVSRGANGICDTCLLKLARNILEALGLKELELKVKE